MGGLWHCYLYPHYIGKSLLNLRNGKATRCSPKNALAVRAALPVQVPQGGWPWVRFDTQVHILVTFLSCKAYDLMVVSWNGTQRSSIDIINGPWNKHEMNHPASLGYLHDYGNVWKPPSESDGLPMDGSAPARRSCTGGQEFTKGFQQFLLRKETTRSPGLKSKAKWLDLPSVNQTLQWKRLYNYSGFSYWNSHFERISQLAMFDETRG